MLSSNRSRHEEAVRAAASADIDTLLRLALESTTPTHLLTDLKNALRENCYAAYIEIDESPNFNVMKIIFANKGKFWSDTAYLIIRNIVPPHIDLSIREAGWFKSRLMSDVEVKVNPNLAHLEQK